ncbi:hypothetical protein QC764_102653 [Podospora pseudoanserina]|uniref:Uncharacterized protein n=1 Tax=Podospora pseudoanserina TaxID=2609844 RepID=A0ABR0IKC9_9PEZI|nr:hypothetical protein QC764_102653 [Podospora pseudoanserina]
MSIDQSRCLRYATAPPSQLLAPTRLPQPFQTVSGMQRTIPSPPRKGITIPRLATLLPFHTMVGGGNLHRSPFQEELIHCNDRRSRHTNPIPTTSSRGECSASAIVTPDHSMMNSNEMTPLLSRTECSWGPESFRYARRLVSEDALPLVTTWLSTDLIAVDDRSIATGQVRFRIRCFSCIRSLPKVPPARTCVQRVYTGRQITGLDIGSPVTEYRDCNCIFLAMSFKGL